MRARTPAVSVLTAALAPDPGYLLEAHDSLLGQAELEWEWIIQLDGERTELPGAIEDDERVRVEASGRRLGTAATRNRALVRTRAELVQNLDADDLLLPGALAAGVAALRADEELAFAFGRTVELRPDGSRRAVWAERIPFAPGRIEAGALDGHWLATGDDPLPISPVMWRRRFALAYGGWAALSLLEDTALVLAAASRHPCFYLDRDTQLYRVHPGQATVAEGYRRERTPNRRFVYERLRALRELDGRLDGLPGELPPDPADALSDDELRRGLPQPRQR